MKFSKKHWLFGLFVAVFALALAFATTRLVSAAAPPSYNWYCGFVILGRQGCHGYANNVNYFTGKYPAVDSDSMMTRYDLDGLYPGASNAFPDAVDTAPEFIAEVEGYLARTNNATVYNYNAYGAAAIVDVMLGENGPSLCASGTCTWRDTEKYAVTHLPEWEARVNYYAAQGWITWKVTQTYPAGQADSTHPCTTTAASGSPCIDAELAGTTAPTDKHDFVFRSDSQTYTLSSIVFNNPNGSKLKIVRLCGNLIGPLGPLATPPDMNMRVSMGGLFDSTGNPAANVAPGGTYTIHPAVFNTGNAASNIVYMELKTPANTSNAGIDAANPYGVSSAWSAVNNCVAGYPQVNVSGSPPGACAGQHWWWEYNGVPAASPVIGQAASFTVSVGAPIGSNICFQADVTHRTIANASDPANYSVSPVTCFPVVSPRIPSVSGFNSDVHAGGGLCPTDQNPGNVQGSNATGGANLGQYVVSAAPAGAVGGMISGFGSDGSSGSNKLQIGQGGDYQQTCRADLYAYAEANKNLADPKQHQLGAGAYTINPSWSGIYYANGPIAVSSNPGGIHNNITIVMESGDLSIDGDITLGPAMSGPRSAPSFGIITNGPAQSVFIEPAARIVEAYIFSDGTVDTCATPALFAPPGCGNKLTINGFLMAKNINLKRTGPDGTTGAQTGEQIQLTPQLYLNPPYFFDTGVDAYHLNGLGERQPLF